MLQIMLFLDSSRSYGQNIIRGIAEYARIHGPWLFFREPKKYDLLISNLKKWKPDGIIAHVRDARSVKDVVSLGIPIVIQYSKGVITSVPNICSDGNAIGEMVARHLLERKFGNYAYCGFDKLNWSEVRKQSFTRTIEDAGFEVHIYKQPRSRDKILWQNEKVDLSQWLASLPKPIGVMACNDHRGQHILESCRTLSLKVPDEVSVVGVDNDELICELACPMLSSVAINSKNAGYEAAAVLHKMISREKDIHNIISKPMHIVTRQSSDIMMVANPKVIEALRFIRKNSNRAIQVTDVADAIAVSRRDLERHFRKALNQSIHERIRTARVEEASRLLLETNLSVSQIALSLGYSSIAQISRDFHREKGITPSLYRKNS